MRPCALLLGLTALAVLAVGPTAGGSAPDPLTSTSRYHELDDAAIDTENPAITAQIAPDSRSGSSDVRRFDAPWAVLAAAALLVAAAQRVSSRRTRRRVAAPLTTRAPARAPPPFAPGFAPAS
jgi:hypothetical protein